MASAYERIYEIAAGAVERQQRVLADARADIC